MKYLVIVESPGKINKIQKFLDNIDKDKYVVKASFGHCRDLESKTLSIDVENNFKPIYSVIPGKNKVIKELSSLAKKSEKVILAADEDREGEMIASSLKDLLKISNYDRIVFHEITQDAINKAINNPTKINDNMVYAQQTRRLLDRLVGYKISPVLWKKLQGKSSAGRVQSVVVKIIIDKEKDIEKSISEPYYKTTGLFEFKKVKFNGLLCKKGKLFDFKDKDTAKDFLESLDSKDKFMVEENNIKDSLRKPSPPFTTSTLQQDASTKLGFNVKRTMNAAQKLYEFGYITYMRTDSTNLSKQCLEQCQQYIINTYGEKYSNKKNYSKKTKNSQEAHEAIRPTNIQCTYANKVNSDGIKLYNLIWERTLASQMSPAAIQIQTLHLINDKLPDNTKFISTLENIIFDGFLILYQQAKKNINDSEEEEPEKGYLKLKKGILIKYKEININQEYTKPPLRYNEAGLVKFLEKNGIGRPSTYSSIISKITEKNYVEIKDVDGIQKESIQMKLKNKRNQPVLTQDTKNIVVGKEKKKLVPTLFGREINKFLIEHFDEIMNIDFTAKFEEYLDKIASGKAKWHNVLDLFYQKFNPIVEKLQKEMGNNNINTTDQFLGNDENNNPIYKGISKYGHYVKIQKENKWQYSPANESTTLEEAIKNFEYPKFLGKKDKKNIYLAKGKYGLYLKYGTSNLKIPDNTKEDDINLETAKKIIDIGDPSCYKSFVLKNKRVNIRKGPYGFYAKMFKNGTKGNKHVNVSLPELNEDNINKILDEDLVEMIMNQPVKFKKN